MSDNFTSPAYDQTLWYTLLSGPLSAVCIGVARIFSEGALFFSQKVDDLFLFLVVALGFLLVALKTQAKTTMLSTPTVQISPICLGVHALPGGALTTFPCKFGPTQFFSALGRCMCTQ